MDPKLASLAVFIVGLLPDPSAWRVPCRLSFRPVNPEAMILFGVLMALAARLAYISLPIYVLKYVTDRNPLTQYYFRVVLYLSTMSVCSVCGVILSIIMTLVGRRYDINYMTARTFYYTSSMVMGIKFTVEGEEHLANQPYVMMGNHQSMLDIIFLGRYVRTHFRLQRCTTMSSYAPSIYLITWVASSSSLEYFLAVLRYW